MAMKVWIDQDGCTGSEVCAKRAPRVFEMRDGVAFVVQDGTIVGEGGPDALADVPADQLDAVIEIAEACEGECIFLEMV